MKVCRKLWELDTTHENAGMYGFGLEVDKDSKLKSWIKVTNGINKYTWIWLEGTHQKNKVDNKIIEKVELLLSIKKFDKIDTYCFMTSDGDYVDIINKLRDRNKFTIVFGKRNASKKLIESCNMFKPWDE